MSKEAIGNFWVILLAILGLQTTSKSPKHGHISEVNQPKIVTKSEFYHICAFQCAYMLFSELDLVSE